MSNREDAMSLVCLIESAQYGLQFGDGSVRKGRALTTEEMRIIEKALYAYAVPVAAPSAAAESGPFKSYDAIKQAGKEAGERNAKLYEYLAQTSGEKAPQQQQQAEPGADERAAFEAWQVAELPSHHGSDYSAADVEFNCYEAALAAWLARGKIGAQSGQRASVADGFHNRLWKLVENYADDVALYNEAVRADAGVAEAGDACLDAERKLRALIETIPTQQQEGSQP